MSTLGERLKNSRTKLGLTQGAVAKSLGIKRANLANWELDRAKPDIVTLGKLAYFYDVSSDYFIETNHQYIPGNSIKGALRNYIANKDTDILDLEILLNQNQFKISFKDTILTPAEKDRLKDFMEIAMEIIRKDKTEKSPSGSHENGSQS